MDLENRKPTITNASSKPALVKCDIIHPSIRLGPIWAGKHVPLDRFPLGRDQNDAQVPLLGPAAGQRLLIARRRLFVAEACLSSQVSLQIPQGDRHMAVSARRISYGVSAQPGLTLFAKSVTGKAACPSGPAF